MNNQNKKQLLEDAFNHLQSGRIDEVMVKCNDIASNYSHEPEMLSLCARVAHQCGKLDCALNWLKGAIILNGTHPEYHLSLGRIYHQMHHVNEAIACFEYVLNIDSTHAAACLQLGLCFFENQEYQKALNHFNKSIQNDPGHAVPYYWMGIAYSKLNKNRRAIGCLEKARALDSTFADANHQLGLIYLQEGKFVQSRDCFYHVISGNSSDWRAWGNLCVVLRDLGELNEAKHAGHRATSLNPDSFQAWHNLGNVYKDMGCHHESISCYEKACTLNPASDDTHIGLGIAYQLTGDTKRAVRSFKMALKNNPTAGTAINNLLNIYMMDCDWDKSQFYENIIHNLTIESLKNRQVPAETPFINLSRCNEPELNLSIARAWSRDIEAKMSGIRATLKFNYPRALRTTLHIGYLSNNFGDHPTAHITRRLYKLHDRRRFKISCFSFGPQDNSRYRQAIQDGCDNFIDIQKMSHAQAAIAINDLGVDILVDLVGFMKGQRMAIPALRPAPVQVRWLGMAGTSGAKFFDYIITDRTVTPENQARYYTEKFVYLPHCYQINDNQPYVDKKDCRKADYGLPKGAFIFCCFNTSYKIDAPLFSSWMRILRRTPCSVLWLMAQSGRQKENLEAKATDSGIDRHRLVFAQKIPKANHLSRLALADLGLDTHRINGAASTSDALWAGLPVLSFQGNHFASRMSSSILNAADLNELITNSLSEYEKQAVKLAEENKMLGIIKSKLIANCSKSHLFNTEESVKQIERAYEIIWQRYLDGEKPCLVNIGNFI